MLNLGSQAQLSPGCPACLPLQGRRPSCPPTPGPLPLGSPSQPPARLHEACWDPPSSYPSAFTASSLLCLLELQLEGLRGAGKWGS